MSLKFLSYPDSCANPNIIVDGPANAGTILTLSHWRGSSTPDQLRADTSAEIVFKYLANPKFHVNAEAVSNNHFDQDGLIGVFALTHTPIALRYRDLLIDAAEAGDFGTYRQRDAARIASVILTYADPDLSPLPKSIFKLPYSSLSSELYRTMLEILPRLLSDIAAYREFWEDDDRKLTESETLIREGVVKIEERPDVDLAIIRIPQDLDTECHPLAIHNRTARSRLLSVKGDAVEFHYRYESWVRMATRTPGMRIDLSPLARELNRIEGADVWIFDNAEQIKPRLYRKSNEHSPISELRFLELLEHELRSGTVAWNPYD
jgi:hypothetical protein